MARDLPLYRAIKRDNIEVAKILIANGADVNARDDLETTPLHKAACRWDKKCIELLISNGADVNARCDFKTLNVTCHEWTPLHFAAESGRDAIVKIL